MTPARPAPGVRTRVTFVCYNAGNNHSHMPDHVLTVWTDGMCILDYWRVLSRSEAAAYLIALRRDGGEAVRCPA